MMNFQVWPGIDTYTGVYCTFAFGAFIEEKADETTLEQLVGAIALNDVVPFRREEYTRILNDDAEKYGYITYFLTHPDTKYRGQGIGSNLYRKVLAEYKKRFKRNKYGLFLDVGQRKLEQKKMYEHLGLRKVGEFGYGESDVDDVYAITWNTS
ncbi:acetyltransferase (GNAT) family domain-containing protein [Ditylenchus destructor]|uniref:Acetyltransferase (GNAT) family domain-containing protein n=1 Tax=Ditylenchus destructor TaxID=166010 RepID=A0AAD4N481_9BILA|nr:acetyltransferase (GNAT) family domain-containing protein [Ditylenchus destructor]